MSQQIEKTLRQRRARYGTFADQAAISQNLKSVMGGARGWMKLAPDQKEALEMLACKIARVLNGDPDYADNWWDIEGYAHLVSDRLYYARVAKRGGK